MGDINKLPKSNSIYSNSPTVINEFVEGLKIPRIVDTFLQHNHLYNG